MQYDVLISAIALFAPTPVLTVWLAVLWHLRREHLALVTAYAYLTASFLYPLSVLFTVIVGGIWSIAVTSGLVFATLMPRHERAVFAILAIVGALVPNMFAHPKHVHPIHLTLRTIAVALLPEPHVWLLLTPDWCILVVIWRMLRHAYPPRVKPNELV
jgi:hypothetical protein